MCQVLIHKVKCAGLLQDQEPDNFKCKQCKESDVILNLSNSTSIYCDLDNDLTRDKLEIRYLKKLLKEKDVIIKCLNTTVESLQQQIYLLKDLHKQNTKNYQMPSNDNHSSVFSKATIQNSNKEYLKSTKITAAPHNTKRSANRKQDSGECSTSSMKLSQTDVDLCNGKDKINETKNKITQKHLKDALTEAEAELKMTCNNYANLENDETSKQEWQTVNYKQKTRKNNKPIVGNGSLATNHVLKSTDNFAFLHVYKLHPTTSVQELEDFLKPIVGEIKCEKLNSRNPEYYSSFKLTIDDCHVPEVMSANLWPKGVCINKFFHPRARTQQNP